MTKRAFNEWCRYESFIPKGNKWHCFNVTQTSVKGQQATLHESWKGWLTNDKWQRVELSEYWIDEWQMKNEDKCHCLNIAQMSDKWQPVRLCEY